MSVTKMEPQVKPSQGADGRRFSHRALALFLDGGNLRGVHSKVDFNMLSALDWKYKARKRTVAPAAV